MKRHLRVAAFCCSLAIAAGCFYAFFTTPMPAATPPTATIPTTPRIVYATREVVVTATPSPLARISAESMTATARAMPTVDYVWPTATPLAPVCAYALTNGCLYQTPDAAPTSAPLERFDP